VGGREGKGSREIEEGAPNGWFLCLVMQRGEEGWWEEGEEVGGGRGRGG
jgi:hypothetical protein